MRNIFVLSVIFLIACAPKSQDQKSSTSKALPSEWVASLPNWTFDLTKFSATQNFIVYETYASGGECSSVATPSVENAIGYEAAGTFTFSNSTAIETVPGMADCSQFDGVWYYSIPDGSVTLEMCESGNPPCVDFR